MQAMENTCISITYMYFYLLIGLFLEIKYHTPTKVTVITFDLKHMNCYLHLKNSGHNFQSPIRINRIFGV